ncbi:unnamed protein product [Ophioblennius macclurei]
MASSSHQHAPSLAMASASALNSPTTLSRTDPGSMIFSKTTIYVVECLLGEGTYGKVVKCLKGNVEKVAIKLIPMQDLRAANAEVQILKELRGQDPDKCNLVKWHQVFMDRSYTCLEFELLDKSLHDFMKERRFQPLSLEIIRPIVCQVAEALYFLKSLHVIHSDLKLENIMLVCQNSQPYRVKVIDFGLAHKESAAKLNKVIQTLPYRCPEILLGLPYNTAVDIWSLGCIAAYLYLGSLLYDGGNECELVRNIVEIQGQPSDTLLNIGHRTKHFFEKDAKHNNWTLRTLKQNSQIDGISFKDDRKIVCLDDMRYLRPIKTDSITEKAAEKEDVRIFVNMVKEMLQLDAADRLTPQQILEHHFISMYHIVAMNPQSV